MTGGSYKKTVSREPQQPWVSGVETIEPDPLTSDTQGCCGSLDTVYVQEPSVL